MKTLLLFIALTCINFVTNAQDAQEVSITITVPNVTNNDGAVLFALYDENSFMKTKPIQSSKSNIKNGIAKVTFTNVTPGIYGISCVHDANSNGKMDFQVNGMPKENFGVSNNSMSYGPPMWDDAKFELGTESIMMEIRL